MLKNMYIKFQQNMVKLIPLRMTSRFIFCNFTNLSLFIFFLSFIDKMGATYKFKDRSRDTEPSMIDQYAKVSV